MVFDSIIKSLSNANVVSLFTKGLGEAASKSAGALGSLGSVLSKTQPILAIATAAFSIFTSIMDNITSSNEAYLESQQKIIDTATENIEKYNAEISSLEELQAKLIDASGDKQKLADIQGDLNKAIGETPGLLNAETDGIEAGNEKLRHRIQHLKEEAELESEKARKAAKEKFDSTKIDNKGAMKRDHDIAWYGDQKIPAGTYVPASGKLVGDYKEYNDLISDKFRKKIVEDGATLYELIGEIIINSTEDLDISQLWSNLQGLVTPIGSGGFFDRASKSEYDDYFKGQIKEAQTICSKVIEDSTGIFDTETSNMILEQLVLMGYDSDNIELMLEDLLNDADLMDVYNKYVASLDDPDADSEALYNELFGAVDALKQKFPALKNIFDRYFNTIRSYTEKDDGKSFNVITASVKNASESFKTLQSSITTANDALSEQATSGYISTDTIQKLTEAGYSSALQIDAVTGAYSLNKDALLELMRAKEEDLKLTLESLQTKIKEKLLEDGIAAETAANKFYDLEKAKREGASDEQLGAMSEYNDILAKLIAIKEQTQSSGTSLANIMNQMQSHAQLINKVTDEIANNGKISFGTLQSISQQFPSLESYVNDYLNGVEGAEAELINKLNSCYATDIDNYNEYYRAKQENDESWWTDYVENAGTWVSDLAKKYGLELENCKTYATTKAAIFKELQETETEIMGLENKKKALIEEHGNSWGEILFLRDYGSKKYLLDEKFSNLQHDYDKLIDEFNSSVKPTTPPDFKSTDYTGGTNKTEDTTDYWKKEFDDQYAELKHRLAMNYITESHYYSEVDRLSKKHFADKAEYLSEYRQYTEEVYKGLLSMQDKAISSIEKLRDLRINMIKSEMEAEKKRFEQAIKDAKKELELIKESINARKEALNVLKDESDHNKEMSEKNQAIAKIQTQLDGLKYDTSRDAAVKRRKLEEELTNAQADLADYITDYEYDKAIEALDKEAELAEESYKVQEEKYQKEIDAIDIFLNDEVKLLERAMNDINGMSDTLFNSMKKWAKETTGDVQEVTNAWKDAYDALQQYNGVKNVQSTLDTLKANAGNNVATPASGVGSNGGDKAPTTNADNSNNGNGSIPFVTEKYLGDKSKLNKDTSIVDRLKYNDKSASYSSIEKLYKHWFGNGYSGTAAQNVQLLNKLKLSGYEKGAKRINKDKLAWTQENGGEMIIRPDGSVLTPLPKGSSVIPANLTENLWDWGAFNPTDFMTPFPTSSVSNMQANGDVSISIGDININGATNLSKSDLNTFRKDIVDDVFSTIQKNRVKSGTY